MNTLCGRATGSELPRVPRQQPFAKLPEGRRPEASAQGLEQRAVTGSMEVLVRCDWVQGFAADLEGTSERTEACTKCTF